MLRVDNLKIGSLPPLSFSVADGECLAVEGPSGSGKTRLLRAIADLDPSSAQIFVDGAERGEMPAPQWRRRVRYVASEPAWWTETPRGAFDMSTPNAAEKVQRALAALGLKAEQLDQSTATLSTGERLRLSLVRALADDPRVLLLDEPTAALDPNAAALAEELIRYQILGGKSVILVSHDAAQIARLSHASLQLARPPATPRPA